MSRTTKKNKNSFAKVSRYLPVFIILLSLTIIIGSTFAYFTDKVDRSSELTFSKVELSSETTSGINVRLKDVIPGTPLVDGALKFSKSIDSEAIYVRAKISFSLPSEYSDDEDMMFILDMLRSSTDFNIESDEQNGAVWSSKQGNYFYLMEAVSEGELTNLKCVDDITTYTLSNEIVVPRDLKQLEVNAQYMKSINFHVAFEAIQADNVSSELAITKETFNTIFPQVETEKSTVKVIFKDFNLSSNLQVIEIEKGQVLNEPNVDIPLDVNNEPTYVIDGWYTDTEFINKYEFGSEVNDSITLYPLAYEVSQGLVFSYLSSSDSYSVAKGTCEDTEIVVPNTYMGKPVTKVAQDGFREMTLLTDIYLPNTITSIGGYAFYKCGNLVLTELPFEVINIESYAFYYCDSLALTYLPINLTSISQCTFSYCTSLSLTKLPAGIISIGDSSFYNCTSLALTELPSGLKIIEDIAFYKCSNLAFTSLPIGITSIGKRVFKDCVDLQLQENDGEYYYVEGNCIIKRDEKEVVKGFNNSVIPDYVLKIGDYAFENCNNFTFTELPVGVTYIGGGAFHGCSNLVLTKLPAGITSIGDYAFYNCEKITLTSLPIGITSIGNSTFDGCTNLALIELPSGVMSIGRYAFNSCKKLTLSELPSGLTQISESAFGGCTNITLTSLPSGLINIGDNAFRYCTNLNYILCESSEVAVLVQGKGRDVTYIYTLQESGYDATNETEVVISDSVTIYTNTIDGYKWVRTSDNKYFKCIITG